MYCGFLFRYGLQEFMVISPADRNKIIDNESRAKVLLSSVSIALANASRYKTNFRNKPLQYLLGSPL